MIDHWGDEVKDAAALYIAAGADFGFLTFVQTGAAVLGMAMNAGDLNLTRSFFDRLRNQCNGKQPTI